MQHQTHLQYCTYWKGINVQKKRCVSIKNIFIILNQAKNENKKNIDKSDF